MVNSDIFQCVKRYADIFFSTKKENCGSDCRWRICPQRYYEAFISLREFYGYSAGQLSTGERKLIICKSEATTIALEVDGIVTIYKQEYYQTTSSIKKDLAKRRDTLDRLIVYEHDKGISEHVLVVNMHNLIRNHLEVETA